MCQYMGITPYYYYTKHNFLTLKKAGGSLEHVCLVNWKGTKWVVLYDTKRTLSLQL